MQEVKSNGFVFASCGTGYVHLANAAAASLRNVAPQANIDLFTDCPDDADRDVFDQVTTVKRSWFRPKFEALIRSRFDKTIYIDADTSIRADISDIFTALEHHEFAAAPVIRNNLLDNRRQWRTKLPLAVPRYNCGLIGVQNTERVINFLKRAEQTMVDENLDHDQSMMREMLFYSDLRIVTLPYEYNMNEAAFLEILSDRFCAPRVLHFWRMRDHLFKAGLTRKSANEVLGKRHKAFLDELMSNDASLGVTDVRPLRPLMHRGISGWLRRIGL